MYNLHSRTFGGILIEIVAVGMQRLLQRLVRDVAEVRVSNEYYELCLEQGAEGVLVLYWK